MQFGKTIKRALAVSTLFLAIATSAFGDNFSLAGNFNAANNPSASSTFSYGWIPEGFVPLLNISVNCFGGNPTDCLTNGLGFPSSAGIEWNGTGNTLTAGTVNVFPDFVTLDPQATPGVEIRFTAPVTSIYSINGNFIGADSGQHPTLGSVLINGGVAFSTPVTSFGTLSPFSISGIALNAGATIDFRVQTLSDASFLSTGVGATISNIESSTPEPATWIMIPSVLAIVTLRKSALLRRA